MKEKDPLHGIGCPNCGGRVPVPEGQMIVRCPYCDLRSLVKGERGMRRYQVPERIQRQDPHQVLRSFFSKNLAIARNATRQAQVTESFLVYLPFWTVWGRAAAWAFGQKKVGSGDHTRYEPREIRIVQEMTWNGAACDVGEFGVNQVPLLNQELDPFDSEALHSAGMVFEPVGSFAEALATAEKQFQDQVRRRAKLDRLSQLFVRFFRRRLGLVYYPLWVIRYLYRERAFQIVVDCYTGQVLYGKAPGNTLYRAAVLVAGMAVGAFLAVDVSTFFLTQMSSDDGLGGVGVGLILFLAGLGTMFAAYRAFRYGEEFEYRSARAKGVGAILPGFENPLETITTSLDSAGLGTIQVKDLEKWINRLS